jgi:hypothetical protein
VYQQQGCARCHGEIGQGGRAMALIPVTMDAGAWTREFQSAHNRDYPASKISDADIQAIHTWLTQPR